MFHFENPNKLVQIMNFIDTEEHQTITREVNPEGDLIEVSLTDQKVIQISTKKLKNLC